MNLAMHFHPHGWAAGPFELKTPVNDKLSLGVVMKRLSISILILCACFASVAWGQQPGGKCNNNWGEFQRTNMRRWNPCETVLKVDITPPTLDEPLYAHPAQRRSTRSCN
jgi:hypothetical protein